MVISRLLLMMDRRPSGFRLEASTKGLWEWPSGVLAVENHLAMTEVCVNDVATRADYPWKVRPVSSFAGEAKQFTVASVSSATFSWWKRIADGTPRSHAPARKVAHSVVQRKAARWAVWPPLRLGCFRCASYAGEKGVRNRVRNPLSASVGLGGALWSRDRTAARARRATARCRAVGRAGSTRAGIGARPALSSCGRVSAAEELRCGLQPIAVGCARLGDRRDDRKPLQRAPR